MVETLYNCRENTEETRSRCCECIIHIFKYYYSFDWQADLTRATLTLNALVESNHTDPWAMPGSELALGVRIGLENVSTHLSTLADTMEQRVSNPNAHI